MKSESLSELGQLDDELNQLLEGAENLTEEEQKAVLDQWESIWGDDGKVDKKLQSYVWYMRRLESDTNMFKEQAKKLVENAKSLEKKKSRMEEYLIYFLERKNIDKRNLETGPLRVQSKGGKLRILYPETGEPISVEHLPPEFITEKTEINKSINRKALETALEQAGEKGLKYAKQEPRGLRLVY